MVVRSSFVTNSSSSSFVCVEVDSKEIADILREFESELEEVFEYCGNLDFESESKVNMYLDEAYADLPSNPKDIVHALAGLFDWRYSNDYCEDEELDMSKYSDIAQRLVACKDEIMANLKAFKMVSGEQGWQGDSESRYYEDWWEADALQDIKEAIAENKGIEVDEVTNEDFCEYVSDQVSSEENICEYNPETKQFTYSRTTELL